MEKYTEIQQRYVSYYLQIAKTANDQFQKGAENLKHGLFLFDIDWPNIYTAANLVFNKQVNNNSKIVCRFIYELYSLISYRNLPDGAQWLLEGFRAARAEGDIYLQGIASCELGFFYKRRGNYTQSLEWYNSSVEIFKSTREKVALARVINNIGELYRAQSKYLIAMEQYLDAITILENFIATHPDNIEEAEQELAIVNNNVGIVKFYKREFTEALEWFEKSIEIRTTLGDLVGLSRNYNNIGSIHKHLKNYKEALHWFEMDAEICIDLNDQVGLSATYTNIGSLHMQLDEYDVALNWLQKALAIKEEHNLISRIAVSYNEIGQVYRKKKEYNQAKIWFRKCCEVSEKLGDKETLGVALHNLGQIELSNNQYAQAIHLFSLSRDIFNEIDLENDVKEEEEMIEKARSLMESL